MTFTREKRAVEKRLVRANAKRTEATEEKKDAEQFTNCVSECLTNTTLIEFRRIKDTTVKKTAILTLSLGLLIQSCDFKANKAEIQNSSQNDSISVLLTPHENIEGKQELNKYVEMEEDFPLFLARFFEEYSSTADIRQHIHSQIGVYTGHNPGAFCMVTHSMEPEIFIHPEVPLAKTINRMPLGDFCEGYPGEEDGIYYIEIKIQEMPKFVYFSESGEILTHNLSPPEGFNYDKIIKVIGIWGIGHQFEFYFALIDSKWYFICQNLCDCSA
jgi:hypothetical protein